WYGSMAYFCPAANAGTVGAPSSIVSNSSERVRDTRFMASSCGRSVSTFGCDSYRTPVRRQSRGLCCRVKPLGDFLAYGSEAFFARFIADREPFGVKIFRVVETDERQELLEKCRLRMFLAAVAAAARDEYRHLLAFDEPFRTVLGVVERHAGACHVIEIILQP